MLQIPFKPIHLRNLKELIKSSGYSIEPVSGSHYALLNSEGKKVYYFAVTHGKGKRDMIKPAYIKKIMELIKEET